MTSLNDHVAEIRDLYAEALLSARLRGIEGVPAKRLALRETVDAVQNTLGLAVGEDELRDLLRVSDRKPFSMVLAQAPRNPLPGGPVADGMIDQRIRALLSQLNDTILGPKA